MPGLRRVALALAVAGAFALIALVAAGVVAPQLALVGHPRAVER